MKRYFILGLLTIIALGINAREYKKGENVYVNVKQSGFNWSNDNAKLFLYFFQSWDSDTQWMTLSRYDGDVFAGTFTSDCVFDRVIVVRKNSSGTSGNWNDRWNQTCNIGIPDNNSDINMLYTMSSKDNPDDNCGDGYVASETWKNYAPPVSKINSFISGLTAEEIKYCSGAVGDPLSLKAKLNEQKTDYYYADVKGHGWYKTTNGTSWTSIDGYAGSPRDGEGGINLMRTIESGVQYYYLHSNIPSGRRLVKMTAITEGCELDCSITSFETAVSSVNADDNTYTLDGMVAFGDAGGKSLTVECDGHSITIDEPKSPQSFSLHGVPAATENGKKTTVTAYFALPGSLSQDCEKSITVDVPNAKEAVEVKTIDALTKTTIELKPTDCDPNNDFVWIINGHEYWKADGAKQQWTIPNSLIPADIMKDSVFSCIYKEYLPAPGAMDDLMTNGKYEKTTGYGKYGQESTMSDYDFWGVHQQSDPNQEINFYDTCSLRPTPTDDLANGFAVVRNANKFHSGFAKVTAREGNNFALFDAATGTDGGNKKAWYAATSNTTNSKLKLKEGTTYVLSFWAANINNYGEMDNAAKFRFYIEDISNIDNPVRLDSSDVLDLSKPEYRNNLWHQCSKTFTAKANCDKIRISVMNLNTNVLSIGNDFALDDIQFHPISVVSKVVKSQQQFNVTVHEPKVTAFTATTLPLNCDEGPEYKVAVEVKYKNPNSKLVIEDSAPNVGNRHEYTLPNIAYETEGTLKDTITVTTNHHSYTWHAYFKEWTTAEATTLTARAGLPRIDTAKIAFSEPACTDLRTTLSFDLKYRYQSGTLTYWVDNMTKKTVNVADYHPLDTAEQTLPLTFEGIDADGKATHKLHISFSDEHSCVKEYTLPALPLSPVIEKVEITSTVPQVVSCSTTAYPIEVKVTTHFEATGQQIVLFYDNNGTDETSPAFAVDGREAETTITVNNIENGQHYIKAAFANRQECTKDLNPKYEAPRVAQISDFDVNVSALKCDENKYTISGSIAFDFLDGNVSDGNLIVEFDADHRQVITSPTSSPANFSIENMTAEGTQLFVTAWFSGSPDDACKKVSNTFDSPGKPHIEVKDIAYQPLSCTDEKATLSFNLDYRFQQGDLYVNGVKRDVTYNEADTALHTLPLTVEDIDADGRTDLHLTVEFKGPNSCSLDTLLPQVPFSPVIRSVTVTDVPTSVLCPAQDYQATITIVTPYDATGKNFIVTYGGNDQIVATTGTSTQVTLTLTDIDGVAQKVFVGYEDVPTCPVVTSTNDLTPPTRVSCVKEEATICEGEDYTWERHNHRYLAAELPVGVDTFAIGYDSLIVMVNRVPHIIIPPVETTCDDATQIRVPFTTEKGQPGNFEIDINGVPAIGTLDIVGTDTAFVFSPATMTAGDYNATVTVSEAGALCTSQETFSFRIAISGQMYSKWTDLLFINNGDGRYTEFQWYNENGIMTGETLQRLYDPEGLPGTYYCRMKTTEDKYIYTCPQTFDEVKPSRDVDTTPKQVRSTTTYDTMGRKIGTTPNKGIYIVIEEMEDGETRTRKIAIYE